VYVNTSGSDYHPGWVFGIWVIRPGKTRDNVPKHDAGNLEFRVIWCVAGLGTPFRPQREQQAEKCYVELGGVYFAGAWVQQTGAMTDEKASTHYPRPDPPNRPPNNGLTARLSLRTGGEGASSAALNAFEGALRRVQR
jgi:hypothetical protein